MIHDARYRRRITLASLVLLCVVAALFVPQFVRSVPNAPTTPPPEANSTPPVPDPPTSAIDTTTVESAPIRAELPTPLPSTRNAIVLGYEFDHPSTSDPVEGGTCTLEISLVDADTAAPIESSVDLWRLHAPPNENWIEGDQRVGRFKVRETGLRIPDLPEGDYRIVILRQTSALPDPDPFEVKGPLTTLRWTVVRPKPLPVWIDLRDESGTPLTARPRIEIQRTATEGDVLNRSTADRPWVQARKKRDPDAGRSNTSGGGLGVAAFGTVALGPEPDGFRINDLATASVAGSPTHTLNCRVDGFERCTAKILGTDVGDARRFVGVCVKRSSIVDRLSYRADWREEDRQRIGKAMKVTASALSRAENPLADSYLDVPIRVTLDDPACAPIDLTFKLRDGLPEIAIELRR